MFVFQNGFAKQIGRSMYAPFPWSPSVPPYITKYKHTYQIFNKLRSVMFHVWIQITERHTPASRAVTKGSSNPSKALGHSELRGYDNTCRIPGFNAV